MHLLRLVTQGLVPFSVRGALVVLPAAGVFGCARESLSDGLSDNTDCSSCHGTAGNSAPPRAVNGETRTTYIGVGAHAIHLAGSAVAAPVACAECHIVPTPPLLTHPALEERPGVVAFGPLARADGAVPAWVRTPADCQSVNCRSATGTCTNTYCHGATLSGAEARPSPEWTRVDGTFRGCASCHGFPPAGTHPANTDCNACHGAVGGTAGVITNPTLHVNGVVDFMSVTSRFVGHESQRFAANVRHRSVTPLGGAVY
jgi:predicted CxxxxCH...CXXCH cytochrome family protein